MTWMLSRLACRDGSDLNVGGRPLDYGEATGWRPCLTVRSLYLVADQPHVRIPYPSSLVAVSSLTSGSEAKHTLVVVVYMTSQASTAFSHLLFSIHALLFAAAAAVQQQRKTNQASFFGNSDVLKKM